jgi:hypothetical protein
MLLVDGSMPIEVPIISPTQPLKTLKLFNVLFAHLFSVLAGSQAMQMYEINPSKLLTVKALLEGCFPAIKSTDDQPTPGPFVTIGYIHALVVDTATVQYSNTVHARALQVETTTRSEIDKWDRDEFRAEFQSPDLPPSHKRLRRHSQRERLNRSLRGCPPPMYDRDWPCGAT